MKNFANVFYVSNEGIVNPGQMARLTNEGDELADQLFFNMFEMFATRTFFALSCALGMAVNVSFRFVGESECFSLRHVRFNQNDNRHCYRRLYLLLLPYRWCLAVYLHSRDSCHSVVTLREKQQQMLKAEIIIIIITTTTIQKWAFYPTKSKQALNPRP